MNIREEGRGGHPAGKWFDPLSSTSETDRRAPRTAMLDCILAGYPEGKVIAVIGTTAVFAWKSSLSCPEDSITNDRRRAGFRFVIRDSNFEH